MPAFITTENRRKAFRVLKRLEIAGFKSFAERVSVDFVPGVTSVVGPNGSGKVIYDSLGTW